MKRLLAGLLLSAAFALNVNADVALYVGQCRNVTYGLDGNLKFIVSRTNDAVTGFLSISGHLVGTGHVSGTWKGSSVTFRSDDPINDVHISWQAKAHSGTLEGEYFVDPRASLGETAKELGEWSATLLSDEQHRNASGATLDRKDDFRRRFIFDLETALNAPVKMPDGTSQRGAQVMFNQIHPAGQAISITVNDVAVVWRDDTRGDKIDDVYKYTITLSLYWHGPIKQYGTTDIRLTYNAELRTYTKCEIVKTDGVTKGDVSDIAFGLGKVIGEVAVRSFLSN